MEFVVGIVHLITTEDGLQTALVKGFVVGHQGQALDERFYLCPDFREDWSFFRIIAGEAMYLGTPIIIVVGLGQYQGVEPVYNLTVPDDDYAHGADARPLVVGRLEVYCREVSHISRFSI